MADTKSPGGDIRREREAKKRQREHVREKLSAQGHIQHINDVVNELNDLTKKMEPVEVQRKKIVIDTKLAIIRKFLPDLKQVEITGEAGGDIKTDNKFTIEVIGAASSDPEEASATSEA